MTCRSIPHQINSRLQKTLSETVDASYQDMQNLCTDTLLPTLVAVKGGKTLSGMTTALSLKMWEEENYIHYSGPCLSDPN